MKNNLKQFRKEAGLTLEELGSFCDVSFKTISGWEKGRHGPTLFKAYKVAKVLEKSVYDIWPDTTEVIEETITVRRIIAQEGK